MPLQNLKHRSPNKIVFTQSNSMQTEAVKIGLDSSIGYSYVKFVRNRKFARRITNTETPRMRMFELIGFESEMLI